MLVLRQSTEIGKHSLGGVSAPGLVKLRNNDVLGLAIYFTHHVVRLVRHDGRVRHKYIEISTVAQCQGRCSLTHYRYYNI